MQRVPIYRASLIPCVQSRRPNNVTLESLDQRELLESEEVPRGKRCDRASRNGNSQHFLEA